MPPSRRRFRDDIQGLRGVAVLAVVADHLNIPGFGGGFTGVDVFFVISGFLLIGLMYREVRHSGGVAVAAFYGRRARRILPAAMLVIFAVVLFAKLTLNPIAIADIGQEAVWSTFFAMNLLLINRGADYFAGYDSVSPLQHYWSLGVEEQFYIVLPVLFLAGLLLVSRGRRGGLGRLVWLLAGISVASLAWCLWSSANGSADTAYFSSLARAWQIGFGGLLAIAFAEGRIILRGRMAGVVGIVGVLVLLLTFVFARGEGYPGWQALLPVTGALAVIASGTAVAENGFTRKLLTLRVLTLTGLISFSIYLWHWPVIIFTDRLWPSFTDSPFHIPVLLAVTLVLSALSYAFVERPARRLSLYRSAERSPHKDRIRRIALPAAFIPAVAIVAFLGLGAAGIVNQGGSGSSQAGGFGTEAEAQWTKTVRQALDLKQIPDDLTPPLAEVPNDGEPMECLSIDRTNMDRCAWGDPGAKKTVAVLGDSHAHMWFTALRYVFPPSRYRVQPLTKAKCLNADIVRPVPGLPAADPACGQHRQWVMRQVRRLRPDLVVMSDYAGADMWKKPDGTPTSARVRAAWRDGLARTLDEIGPLTSHIVLIGQTPEGKALADCLPRDLALADCYGDDTGMATQWAAERQLVEAVGGTFIDPGPWLCVDGLCPPVIDGTAVFHDDNHLTVSLERKLAPLLAEKVRTGSPG